MPHWTEGRKVVVELFVGFKTPSESDTPVWTTGSGVRTNETIKTMVNFTLPEEMTQDRNGLKMYVRFSFPEYDTLSELQPNLKHDEQVFFSFNLTTWRRPQASTGHRNLLDSSGSTDAPLMPTARPPVEEETLHWRFTRHPVIVRYGLLHRVLGRVTFRDSGITVKLRKKAQYDSAKDVFKRSTQKVFNPLLWIDDVSILRHHYVPLDLPDMTEQPPRSASSLDNEVIDLDIAMDGTSPANAMGAGSGDTGNGDGAATKTRQPVPGTAPPPVERRASLEFHFVPTSMLYFVLKRQTKVGLNYISSDAESGGLGLIPAEDLDDIRSFLSEDRLWSFFLTQLIGFSHLFLETMAFRDEWQFYRGRRNFVGLSMTSLGITLLRHTIIFLYLWDNDSSWILLMLLLKDILFVAWKMLNVYRARHKDVRAASARDAKEANALDEKQRLTAEYDTTASRATSIVLLPVVAAAAAYSLKHYQHRSWFSWAVSSAADGVYLLGFAGMVPQIYINYKFKSVAHLPIRPFLYKVFNTFIDDVFAFSVKMPLKHRLMTFRDDLVFIVFLYQWYIYPADKTRPNEFGFQYDVGREGSVSKGQEPVEDGDPDANEEEENDEEYDEDEGRDKPQPLPVTSSVHTPEPVAGDLDDESDVMMMMVINSMEF